MEGYRIQYSTLGEIIYKDEFKEGQPHGIGVYYFEDGYYAGEAKEGFIEGYGIKY